MAKPTTNISEFLSRQELVARWGCSLSTIKRREAEGVLVPVRFGPRLVRYSMADIEVLEQRLAIGPRHPGNAPETGTGIGQEAHGFRAAAGSSHPNPNQHNATSPTSNEKQ